MREIDGLWSASLEVNSVTLVQNPGQECLHSANNIRKGMNSSILPLVMITL